MHRRTFLTAGSVAAIGFGVSACSTNSKPSGAPKRAPVSLVPVKASWDRVIRTTVGLRPHRDAGFVLKTDKLDDKLLIHNYGHGGAGMSLAWGTGSDGRGVRDRTPVAPGGGDRLRIGRPHLRAPAAAPRLRRDDLCARRTAECDVEHVAGRLHARVGPRAPGEADAGVGRAISPRRRHLVPPAAAARRPALRRVVARQLLAGRGTASAESGYPRAPEPDGGAGSGAGRARSGGAPVRDEVRAPLAADSHRAEHLSRQPGPRFPALGRPHRHPQIRYAARAGGVARANRRSTARGSARRICSATRSCCRSRDSSPC